MRVIVQIVVTAVVLLASIVAVDMLNSTGSTSAEQETECIEDFSEFTEHQSRTARILCSFQRKCVVEINELDNEEFEVECGNE